MLESLIWAFALPIFPLPLEMVVAAEAGWRNQRWAEASAVNLSAPMFSFSSTEELQLFQRESTEIGPAPSTDKAKPLAINMKTNRLGEKPDLGSCTQTNATMNSMT